MSKKYVFIFCVLLSIMPAMLLAADSDILSNMHDKKMTAFDSLWMKKMMYYSDDQIYTDSSPRCFTGEDLGQIRFPLGGIGTGTVALGGRGELKDWELFNEPNRNSWLPYSFFMLRISGQDHPTSMRVLEREWLPPYNGTRGVNEDMAPGLPRFRECRFTGEYPFATIEYIDKSVPIKAELNAWNPLIPLNLKDSSLPVAIFNWTLTNTSDELKKVDLYSMLCNPIGYRSGSLGKLRHPHVGQNLNTFRTDESLSGIFMTNEKIKKTDPAFGTMAVTTLWNANNVNFQLSLPDTFQIWIHLQEFWERLEQGGKLANDPRKTLSKDGYTHLGILGCQAILDPGETIRIPFIMTWHFPNRNDRWFRPKNEQNKTGNWYAQLFDDAWDVATYVSQEMDRLYDETRSFHKAFYSSTLPGYVLERISATLSSLRSNSCFMDKNGRFFGYEGCRPGEGCCQGSCTHVYNYSQAIAYLFPQLEQSARRTEFVLNTTNQGSMPFRTPLPPGVEPNEQVNQIAADGQMGCILRAYREWLISGDKEFIRDIWPPLKRALEFAWKRWDRDQNGVMETDQHTTTDRPYYGPTPYTSFLYISALNAAANLAETLGESDTAQKYRSIARSGQQLMNANLWNGQFFEQDLTGWESKPHQLGKACMSDQLMGQWYADMLGLNNLSDHNRIAQTLRSIFAYNWQTDLHDFPNTRRAFAINDEQAMVYCTWPLGGKPRYAVFRDTEVWTGIEYHVASHLIYRGMLKEGLSVIKAIAERHNGKRRNPWMEMECGAYYVRAMSSWATLLALGGFQYSAPDDWMGFSPRINQSDFKTFWVVDGAWGTFAQEKNGNNLVVKLAVNYGLKELKKLSLDLKEMQNVKVILEKQNKEQEVPFETEYAEKLEIQFDSVLQLSKGSVLLIVGEI